MQIAADAAVLVPLDPVVAELDRCHGRDLGEARRVGVLTAGAAEASAVDGRLAGAAARAGRGPLNIVAAGRDAPRVVQAAKRRFRLSRGRTHRALIIIALAIVIGGERRDTRAARRSVIHVV